MKKYTPEELKDEFIGEPGTGVHDNYGRKLSIKLEFDRELETLSGTILFPEKLEAANKFLLKKK